MADTRTLYLVADDGVIFTSDPSESAYQYLLMTDFTNLNPTDTTNLAQGVNIYDDYDVTVTLTFNSREERAEWVANYQSQIHQISVANTSDQSVIFNKSAYIKSVDLIENPYINGVQAELVLILQGVWSTSISSIDSNVGDLIGGNKKYPFKYNYQYGSQVFTSDYYWSDANSFILSIKKHSLPITLTIKSQYGTVSLTTTKTNVPLQISSDMAGYEISDFDKFTTLDVGFSATRNWDNFLAVYGTLKAVIQADVLTVTAVDSLGTPVTVDFYKYNSNDFI